MRRIVSPLGGFGSPFGRGLTLGPELVTNGGFDADTNWTKGTGWTISGGVAQKTAGTGAAIQQSVAITAGRTYEVSVTVTRSAGFAFVRLGSTSDNSFGVSAIGTFTRRVVAGSTNTILYFFGDAAFVGTIDNFSVRLLT
jgi:hypothetical protein